MTQRIKSRLVKSLLLLIAINVSAATCAEIYTPAEFDDQEALWVGWSYGDSVNSYSVTEDLLNVIAAMASHSQVTVQVKKESDINAVEGKITRHGIDMDNINFAVGQRADAWLRDMGPVFRFNDGVKEMVDFQFDGWGTSGRYDSWGYAQEQGNLDKILAKEMGINVVSSWLIHEGGNQEFNGQGTMMMTWAVEKQRNPEAAQALRHYTAPGNDARHKAVIEEEYKRIFGVTNIVWLEEGLVEDPLAYETIPGPFPGTQAYSFGTGGHVDEIARFVDANTILLAEISEEEALNDSTGIAAESRARLEENYDILKAARDQDGKRFTIIRMPHPDMEYVTAGPADQVHNDFSEFLFNDTLDPFPGGEVYIAAAKSYMNFIIANGVVVVPQYFEQGDSEQVLIQDRHAIEVLQNAFPDREVVGVNPFAINLGGGGMHCMTAHEPSGL